jgi:diguanylate cyclase (GGDEF)-like protein
MQTNNNFHILIVDDEKINIELAAVYLKEEGYKLSFALDAEAAFAFLEKEVVDLILLDINMPKMDGFEVCKILKSQEATQKIPIIFLTAQTSIEYITQAFEVGGVDYLIKPFNGMELKVRVHTQLQNVAYLQEIRHKQSKLAQLSITDNLTKLKNGLYFDAQVKQLQKSQEPFWFVYIKIDKLDKINTMYGFYNTNKVLKHFAKVLEASVFKDVLVARLYGASFALLLKDYDKETLQKLYIQIDKAVSKDPKIGKIVQFLTVLYRVQNTQASMGVLYKNIYEQMQLLQESRAKYSFL